MATFPALEPLTRSYTLGSFPITRTETVAGPAVRFLHGTQSTSYELKLGYENLTDAEAALIRSHYIGQKGTFLSFVLSPEAWAGHASLTDVVPSTHRWRYASPPEEEHLPGGLYNVSVTLEAYR